MANHLGHLIRQARTEAGLTREQMAPKIGVTSSTLYRYETGANDPSVRRVTVIARVTGKPLSYFLTEAA